MNNLSNQSSIRLCRAVEQHSCLYDRSHPNYDKRAAYDGAWRDIAATCGEPVTTCKLRWRNIRTAFVRSVGSPKKRKGNRIRDYYLHDVLEFFLPHIYGGMDESDDETDSVKSRKSTTSNQKKDEENVDNSEVVDESKPKTDGQLLQQQQIESGNIEKVNKDNLGELENVKEDNIENKTGSDLANNAFDSKGVRKDNTEDTGSTQKDNLGDTKRVQKDNIEDTKRVQKESVGKIKEDQEEVADEIKNEDINKNDENMIDSAIKRPLSARPRRSRKTNEDIKIEENSSKSVESRPTRKTQSQSKIDRDEYDNNATNDQQERREEAKCSNRKLQPTKGKGTFYIRPRNGDSKFIIKNNNSNNDTEEPKNEKEEDDVSNNELASGSKLENSKAAEADNVDASSDDMPLIPQSRVRRACKRVSEKATPTQLRVRQKESKAKELKNNTERLKTLSKATAQLVAPQKMQIKPQTNVEPKGNQINPSNKMTRILCRPRIVVVDPDVIEVKDTTLKGIQTKAPPNQHKLPPANESTTNPARKMETQNIEMTTKLARTDQGIQCSLQEDSSDDEFLQTLKPYLLEMNARQKLHFKKKIYESLMEVFDSGSDFPTNGQRNAGAVATSTAIIPKQLSSVRDDELRLVRELVAIVQAAKHTTDLHYEHTTKVSDTSLQVHTASSFEKHAPFTPINATATSLSQSTALVPSSQTARGAPLSTSTSQSVTLRNPTLSNPMQIGNRSMQPISTSATTVTSNSSTAHSISTSTASASTQPRNTNMSPTVQRRVVRKLVKVNADGQVTYSTMPATTSATTETSANGEPLLRRIYRILPKSSTGDEQSVQHAVTSSGVGTFIVPRTTDVTANIETPRIRVGSNAPPALTTTASTSVNKQIKKSASITVASGARPLIRRYSVCGALQNVTIDRHTANTNKFLTTTANTRDAQTAPKITIGSRNSPPKMFSKDIFKLPPTSTRSTITTLTTNTNTTVTVVVTNTTNSRSTPIVSVSNSSARTVPLTAGFNRYFRGDGNTKGSPTSQSSSVAQNSYSTPSQASVAPNTHISQPRISISQSARASSSHYSNKSQSRVTVSQHLSTSRASISQNSNTSQSQYPVSQSSCTTRDASSDVSTPSPPPQPPAFVACNPIKRSYERSSFANVEKRFCSDMEMPKVEEPLEEDMLGLGIIASDAFDVLHIKEEPEDTAFQY